MAVGHAIGVTIITVAWCVFMMHLSCRRQVLPMFFVSRRTEFELWGTAASPLEFTRQYQNGLLLGTRRFALLY